MAGKIAVAPRQSLVTILIMNWQETAALGIVAITLAFFARHWLGRRKFSFARDTHCGCSAPPPGSSPPSIVLHARKGERAVVTVKQGGPAKAAKKVACGIETPALLSKH